MKHLLALSASLVLLLSGAAKADVTVESKQTFGGQEISSTTFIKGNSKRVESMNGSMVTITRCDTGAETAINPAFRTYYSTSPGSARGDAAENLRGGTLTVTSTLRDTGERKPAFGYTARKVRSTIVYESSADACNVTNNKIEIEGWYIDAEFGGDCAGTADRQQPPADGGAGGCRDRIVTKNLGSARKGFAIFERITILDELGRETTVTTEVTDIRFGDLDASLFDVPEGYSRVNDRSELFRPDRGTGASTRGSLALPGAGKPAEPNVDGGAGREPAAPKTEGVVRIGIANLRVSAAGEGIPAQDLSEAFRNTFAEYLKMPGVEVVMLESRLPSTIKAEADELGCDLVLLGTISHKKGGGGFGSVFGKVIAPAVGSVGIGQTGSVAGNIAGQAATHAIISAGAVAANVKAKDEITFDLEVSGGLVNLRKQFRRKAKSNGEDLVTPIVEEASDTIASLLRK